MQHLRQGPNCDRDKGTSLLVDICRIMESSRNPVGILLESNWISAICQKIKVKCKLTNINYIKWAGVPHCWHYVVPCWALIHFLGRWRGIVVWLWWGGVEWLSWVVVVKEHCVVVGGDEAVLQCCVIVVDGGGGRREVVDCWWCQIKYQRLPMSFLGNQS
jgi:hypothetical protein